MLECVPYSTGHCPVNGGPSPGQDASQLFTMFAPSWVVALVSARTSAAHPFGPFVRESRFKGHKTVQFRDVAQHGNGITDQFNLVFGRFVEKVDPLPPAAARGTYAGAVGPPPGAAAAAAAAASVPTRDAAMPIVSERAAQLRLLARAVAELSRIASARSAP